MTDRLSDRMSDAAREQILNCRRAHRDSWAVIQRNCNYSAFSGYAYTPSDYSLIGCTECGRRWRTKANYVRHLPDLGRE